MEPIVTAFIVICILAISCLAIVLVMKHLHPSSHSPPSSPPSPPPSPPSPPPSSDDKLKKDIEAINKFLNDTINEMIIYETRMKNCADLRTTGPTGKFCTSYIDLLKSLLKAKNFFTNVKAGCLGDEAFQEVLSTISENKGIIKTQHFQDCAQNYYFYCTEGDGTTNKLEDAMKKIKKTMDDCTRLHGGNSGGGS